MDDSGLRANDTLANERTFLAYIRTALSFVAFGYVIARFSLFTREIAVVAHIETSRAASTNFGVTVAFAGIAVALYGAFRYVETDRGLRAARVIVMPPWVAWASGLVVAAIGVFVAIELLSFAHA